MEEKKTVYLKGTSLPQSPNQLQCIKSKVWHLQILSWVVSVITPSVIGFAINARISGYLVQVSDFLHYASAAHNWWNDTSIHTYLLVRLYSWQLFYDRGLLGSRKWARFSEQPEMPTMWPICFFMMVGCSPYAGWQATSTAFPWKLADSWDRWVCSCTLCGNRFEKESGKPENRKPLSRA